MTKPLTQLDKLTPGKAKLLEAMQSGSYATVTELCATAGVSRETFYQAIKDQEFVHTIFSQSSSLIYVAIPEIIQKIVKQAKQGSFGHQKMLLEMVKLYQTGPEVAIQVNNTTNYSRGDLVAEAYEVLAEEHKLTVDEVKERLA